MCIYGTYKVKKLQVEDRCMTLEELNALPDTPFGMAFKAVAQEAAGMVLVIGEGFVKMGSCIPEEMREMAAAEGAPMDENGCIFDQEAPLAEDNGAYYIDAGEDKMPLEFDDEGYLVMPGGIYYAKV